MQTVINFTTQEKTKKEAQKKAKKMGVSLDEVMNYYLNEFVTTKESDLYIGEEVPNEATWKALQESEADVKASRVISFNSFDEAIEYVRSLKKDGRHRKSSH